MFEAKELPFSFDLLFDLKTTDNLKFELHKAFALIETTLEHAKELDNLDPEILHIVEEIQQLKVDG